MMRFGEWQVSFDINEIEEGKEATFDVVVATTETGANVGFTVLGTSSDAYRKVRREVEMAGIKAAAKSRRRFDMATDDGAEFVIENAEKARLDTLKACVVGWFGFTLNGEEAPLTPENLERVFKARPSWAELVVREIENDANFMKG